jgi:hypothetical protein
LAPIEIVRVILGSRDINTIFHSYHLPERPCASIN